MSKRRRLRTQEKQSVFLRHARVLTLSALLAVSLAGVQTARMSTVQRSLRDSIVQMDMMQRELLQRLDDVESLNTRLAGAGESRQPEPQLMTSLALHAYPVPENVTFCGEELPLEDSIVHQRFEDEWNRFLVNRHWLISWMRRARDAYPPVEAKLARAGLPDDLKYVMTIESAINPRATSAAGAAGYWQFIRGTGKQYGLRRSATIDERRDLDRATDAAIAYLSKLHEEFGSWTLALSAYNAGETRIRKCIEAQGTEDYYALNLPSETEAYWFKAAAVKILFENRAHYGFHLPEDGWAAVSCDTLRIDVRSSRLELREITEVAGLSYRELKGYNPWLRASYMARGRNKLVLPTGASQAVLAAFEEASLVGSAAKERVDARAEAEPAESEPVVLDLETPTNSPVHGAPWH